VYPIRTKALRAHRVLRFNLFVIEQDSNYGIRITFKEHAAVGVPVTLFSLAVLVVLVVV